MVHFHKGRCRVYLTCGGCPGVLSYMPLHPRTPSERVVQCLEAILARGGHQGFRSASSAIIEIARFAPSGPCWRGDGTAVGRPSEGENSVGMPSKLVRLLTRGDFPHEHIPASIKSKLLAIRRPGHSKHGQALVSQRAEQRSRCGIPHVHRSIAVTSRQLLAIGDHASVGTSALAVSHVRRVAPVTASQIRTKASLALLEAIWCPSVDQATASTGS
jgi:hypothetical protein